ncbi:MAG: hypothetical protein C5B47_00790 [Verrucomicrobia bacterium]|nr:MAG: hypothetical protein C5B47_00790 [Verrucomicrobiota bacterium]
MNNKFRNRLLALACLFLFLGGGVALYYFNWFIQKPFSIILFIADGLTSSTLTASRLYEGGADHRLVLESLPHLALLSTYANDYAVPDDASAATALATGQKVNRLTLAMDGKGSPLPSLADLARAQGRSVGLITNSSLTSPGLAAFFAKTSSSLDVASVSAQLADGAIADIFLGGGGGDFFPADSHGGRRRDGRNLFQEMRQKGYTLVRTRAELNEIPLWHRPKIFGVFALDQMAFSDEIQAGANQPTLAEMVRQAIQLLQYNRKGYLLVVDASLIDAAAYRNEGERVLRCMGDLDKAVATALQYAGNTALIIVTGKQSVGGLRLNGYPFRRDKGVSLISTNTQGVPSLTWSTGPGKTDGPAAWPTSAALGIAEDILVLGGGPGSERLTGMEDNTLIFKILESAL